MTSLSDDACKLLDRALQDYERAERFHRGQVTPEPLLAPERRWDIVKQARDLLASRPR